MLRRNPFAIVDHAQVLALGVAVPAQGYFAAIGGVFHCIEGEVGEGATQLSFNPVQAGVAVNVQTDMVASFAGQGFSVLADMLQQRAYIDQLVFARVI